MSISTVVSGNVVRDAVVNKLSDSHDAVSFTVAVNRNYQDKDGKYVDEPTLYVPVYIPVKTGNGAKLAETFKAGRVEVIVQTGFRGTRLNPTPNSEGKTYHQASYPVKNILKFGFMPKGAAA